MPKQRPTPEKLLQRAQDEARKEKRGKLKIYLGAAPGVGKTYTMLHDALQEQAKGHDILLGIAESHGRKEIEALLQKFEALPRQIVEYHGIQLPEFDLDAALKRHPGLILVDEMAHTNAPNLRHAKRWQDIKELLDRGIDVYTTLNVQHIESLNDDIAQIIFAPVKETVPDSVIEMADTIELIDIPPDELLERLKEGKVYIPAQATLAAENFFRKGNLIALRELALRIMAEWVNTEVLLYRQDQGIKQIWRTKDKILVCVGPEPESLKLIHKAKRIANSLQASWVAVYIDTPRLRASEKKRNRAISHLRLAEQLGAETRVLVGFDIVKEIMIFAREQNVTQIMIWKTLRTRWRNWFRHNLADEIVRQSGDIDVYIMTGERSDTQPEKNIPEKKTVPWKIYGISLGFVALATGVDFALYPYLATSNLIMVYLLATALISLFGYTGPAIVTSILSVFAYDYLFIPPVFIFAFPDIQYLLTLTIMLLVAQIISHLTIVIRRQAEFARQTQHQTSTLYSFSRQLAGARGIKKLIETGTQFIADNINSDVIALLSNDNQLGQKLPVKEQGIAQWVYELGQKAGLGTDTLSFSNALYVPLLTSSLVPIGVLRIQPRTEKLFTPEQMQFIETCAQQLALALEVDRT